MSLQEELQRVARSAQEEFLEKKRQELAEKQRVEQRVGAVDFSLRLPLLAGAAVLNVIESIPRRLYEDVLDVPDGFNRMVLAPNATKDELGGHVLVFDASARLLKSSMLLSTKHAFGVTGVFVLQENVGGTLTSFRGQYAEALKASVERIDHTPPPTAAYMPVDERNVRDRERWPAFLPVHSHVGIYRKDRNVYLIVKANAGPQIVETLDAILAEDGMTMGSFAVDWRVKRVKTMVVRNVRRIAARIARDLGFSSSSAVVETRDDVFTCLANDLSYYELATPLMIVKHNHIRLDASTRNVHVYVDAACHSAVVYDKDEYIVWCGRTRDYVVAVRPNDSDATVLPLKTDKLLDEERHEATDEEQEAIAHHVHYAQPRSELTGRYIKYQMHSGAEKFKHVSSVHV